MDVSIIIISYNYSQYIEECIISCLFQDDTNIKYEVIIFNVINSINLISDGINSFCINCLEGITINKENINKQRWNS